MITPQNMLINVVMLEEKAYLITIKITVKITVMPLEIRSEYYCYTF